MVAEEENKNLNEPAVCVRHKNNSFLATFFSVSYLVIIFGDRLQEKSLFISVCDIDEEDDDDYYNDDDDDNEDDHDDAKDDDEDKSSEKFLWTGLTVKHFDIVHRITRILKLIPYKLATACAIAAKNIGDSREFLLNLVAKLYNDSLAEVGFVHGEIDQREIEDFLKQCQPILNAATIVIDWAHSELVHYHRHQTYSEAASEKLLDLCLDLNSKTNLLSEYWQLRQDNEKG
jgi:hypothetical protein